MLLVQALIHQVCVSRRRSRWAWWEKLSAEVNMALVQMKTDWQKCQWYPGPWTWLYESSVRMDSLPRKRDLLSETQFRKTDLVEVIRECRTTHRYSSKASLGSGCTASTSILIACDEDSLGLDITLCYPITCANKPLSSSEIVCPIEAQNKTVTCNTQTWTLLEERPHIPVHRRTHTVANQWYKPQKSKCLIRTEDIQRPPKWESSITVHWWNSKQLSTVFYLSKRWVFTVRHGAPILRS